MNLDQKGLLLILLLQIGVQQTIARGQSCHLDDVQRTSGECMSIQSCRYAIGMLYTGEPIKRCDGGSNIVCCPTELTLSQKKCREYNEILKAPRAFGQPSFATPQCAYEGKMSFIVGGRKASEFEFPHAVGLGYGDNPENLDFACGATLISDSFLVTAAHCLNSPKKGSPKWAVIGDVTLKTTTSSYRQRVRIVEYIPHPNYHPPKIYNDIALLRLGEKLELSRYLLPACLGDPVVTPKTGKVQAVGWGQLGYLEDQATHLQAVNLTIIPTKKCNQDLSGGQDPNSNLRYPQGFIKSQLCAGDTDPIPDGGTGKDTCNGDSGGGIVVNPQVRCLFHVVGLTSVGSKFCGYGEPGIYTKIASYIDWIERTVWK